MSMVTALRYSEKAATPGVSLALMLFDGFSGESPALGGLDVAIAGQAAPLQKTGQSTFVFFGLPDGSYNVQVSSADATPYYQPVTIPITVPFGSFKDATTGQQILWPAYPDISKADTTKPLSDPAQPLAYREQRQLAGLNPTSRYPFPSGTTLVRGMVLNGTSPASGASVTCAGAAGSTLTDGNGEFALIFSNLTTTQNGATSPVSSKTMTVQATFGTTEASSSVLVLRGTTTGTSLQLIP